MSSTKSKYPQHIWSGEVGRGLDRLAVRAATSVTILVIALLACFWVPAALAVDSTPSGEQQAAAAGNGEVSGAEDDSGACLDDCEDEGSDTAFEEETAVTEEEAASIGQEEAGGPSGGEQDNGGAPSNQAPAAGKDSAEPVPDGANAQNAAAEEYQYDLELICGYGEFGVYWASRDDYEAGLLSIDYRLMNKGPGTAEDLKITKATATNGVTLWTDPLPFLGDLESGDWLYFTLKWYVPKGVGSFQTTIEICAFCDDGDGIDDGDDDCKGDECDDDEGDDCKGDECDDDEGGDDCEGDECDEGGMKDEDDKDLDDGGDDPANDNSGENLNPADEGGARPAAGSQLETSSGFAASSDRSALPATGLDMPVIALMSLALMTLLAGALLQAAGYIHRRGNGR